MKKDETLKSAFNLKNEETVQAILEVIRGYEGIPENPDEYLARTYANRREQLHVEVKKIIFEFWNKHKSLTVSDVSGLFNFALLDFQTNILSTSREIDKEREKERRGKIDGKKNKN